jgi:hypothetical protein
VELLVFCARIAQIDRTLLGPEATRASVHCFSDRDCFEFKPAGLTGMGVLKVKRFSGVVFENCTVDASIFVVKLLRAYGGCLGIRSR